MAFFKIKMYVMKKKRKKEKKNKRELGNLNKKRVSHGTNC
jgi:hypothetical protein